MFPHGRGGTQIATRMAQRKDNYGKRLKVHLIGHSMGGETIRMLAQLLENGDADERNATRDGSISPLFTGECRHWIESITLVEPNRFFTARRIR